MKEPFEFQPQVDLGVKLLDERLGPGWVEKINLATLALAFDCDCVLGQLSADLSGVAGSYDAAGIALFSAIVNDESGVHYASAVAHGFDLGEGENSLLNFRSLTECWRQTILSRLEGGSA